MTKVVFDGLVVEPSRMQQFGSANKRYYGKASFEDEYGTRVEIRLSPESMKIILECAERDYDASVSRLKG